MESKATLKIDKETHKRLKVLKAELGVKTLGDVIKYLLKGK